MIKKLCQEEKYEGYVRSRADITDKDTFYGESGGNRLATLVGFNAITDHQVARDVAMQVAAMSPLAVDKDGIDQETIDRELEIAKDLARQEGKPEEMLEKIAFGRLNKFYKENTLLNQAFIKDGKKTVAQYLKDQHDSLSVTCFKRVGLSN